MGSSKAYFLLQRAVRIVELEHELPKRYRIQHLNRLRSKFKSEFTAATEEMETNNQTKETVRTFRERIDGLKQKIDSMKDNMVNLL
jgi:hypothetical protein